MLEWLVRQTVVRECGEKKKDNRATAAAVAPHFIFSLQQPYKTSDAVMPSWQKDAGLRY